MESLKKLLSPETCEKLERLVALDDRFTSQVELLEICASALLAVQYGAELLPLREMSDLAAFNLVGLDIAAFEIGRLLSQRWPIDPEGKLLAYIEANDYRLTGGYAERKVRITEAGKYQLLIRISQRIAERRAGQQKGHKS